MGGLGAGGGGPKSDKGLQLPVMETLRLAWADPDLRTRILFILGMFAVFALGVHVPVPIPGVSSSELFERLKDNPFFALLDAFGGGALRRVSIFALGLNPYITSSIILQILTTANPVWKKELQEGGEYARRQQNKRTRALTLILCVFQGMGLLQMISQGVTLEWSARIPVLVFWTAGAMFMLWLGEQISEKGIGNGVSLMIFAGIVINLPYTVQQVANQVRVGSVSPVAVAAVILIFFATTWFIVYFTTFMRDGRLHFGNDLYGRDRPLVQAVKNGAQPTVSAVQAVRLLRELAED